MNAQDKPERKVFSIGKKILLMVSVMLLCAILLLTMQSMWLMRSSTVNALEQSVRETARIAAARVDDYLRSEQSVVSALAERVGALYYDDIAGAYNAPGAANLEKELSGIAAAYDFDLMYVVDAEGYARTVQHSNIAQAGLAYYEDIAIRGKDVCMSDVVSDTGTMGGHVINFASRIDDKDGKMIGVLVCKKRAQQLAALVAGIKVGEKGSTFIMSGSGECIAHDVEDMMYGGALFGALRDNPAYLSLNALWDAMCTEPSGFTTYTYEGSRFAAFTRIDSARDWSLAVTADEGEFMREATWAMLYIALTAGGLLVVSLIACMLLIRPITRRIIHVSQRLARFSRGDLTDDLPFDGGNDEVSVLNNSTRKLILDMQGIIKSINSTLTKMAEGDLTVKTGGRFEGDFGAIKSAVDLNIDKLAEIVEHISRTADELSRGTAQIADGATELAQGAAEQAGSIDELYKTVSEMTGRAKALADPKRRYVEDDGEEAPTDEAIEVKIESAPTTMDKLLAAMASIQQRLDEIHEISGTIEDMSSETGMLALNASVEASHAGEYGKGFAVIARQIKELSDKSKQEAKNTDRQITGIMRAVERANRVVGVAVESVGEMTEAFSRIELTLSQLSAVIENTAATAEESAAGSEELSAQADVLKEMVSDFNCEKS